LCPGGGDGTGGERQLVVRRAVDAQTSITNGPTGVHILRHTFCSHLVMPLIMLVLQQDWSSSRRRSRSAACA
jgi:hypothetical protein